MARQLTEEEQAEMDRENEIQMPPAAERPRTSNTLTSAVNEFDPLVERLDKAVMRARAIGDRINGSRPRQENAGMIDPHKQPTPSLIASVRSRRDHMVRALDALERELSAVEECL